MSGMKRKLPSSPETSKKSKVCEDKGTEYVLLENNEYDDCDTPMHPVIDLSEDDESKRNPKKPQLFNTQEHKALSDDIVSDKQDDIENMSQDELQNQAVSTDLSMTHEDTKYMVFKMTRYYCTVCNTSYSLERNCLHHVDTMHPELTTSYENVEAKISKVYQCETCRKMIPSLQSVHKHSSMCSKFHTTPESEDDKQYKLLREKRSLHKCETCREMIPLKSLYTHSSICANSQILEDTPDAVRSKTLEDDAQKPVAKRVKVSSSADSESDIKIMYKCKECLNYFPTPQNKCMDDHSTGNKTHCMIMKKMYKCPVCARLCPVRKQYTKHIETEHPNKSWGPDVELKMHSIGMCLICPTWRTKFHANKKLLVKHMLKHKLSLSDITFPEEVNDDASTSSEMPTVDSKKDDEKLNAIDKEKISSDMAQLIPIKSEKNVKQKTTKENPDSNTTSNTEKSRKEKNKKSTHSIVTKNILTCPVCNKIFPAVKTCHKHINTKHLHKDVHYLYTQVIRNEQEVCVCHICPYRERRIFPNMTLLTQHMLKHHNTTPSPIESSENHTP